MASESHGAPGLRNGCRAHRRVSALVLLLVLLLVLPSCIDHAASYLERRHVISPDVVSCVRTTVEEADGWTLVPEETAYRSTDTERVLEVKSGQWVHVDTQGTPPVLTLRAHHGFGTPKMREDPAVREDLAFVYQRLLEACPDLPPWEDLEEESSHPGEGGMTGLLVFFLASAILFVVGLAFFINGIIRAVDRREAMHRRR